MSDERSFGDRIAEQTAVTVVATVAAGVILAFFGIPPEPNTCLSIGTAIGGGSSS